MPPERQAHSHAQRLDQRGSTFAELLTALVVFSVVGAAILSVVVTTLTAVGAQARYMDAQLDVASAMALLQDDLRAAGYVMDNMAQPTFQQLTSGSTADSVTFVGDVNSDDVSERITYAAVNGQLMRTQDVWDGVGAWTLGTPQPVATNVTVFTLRFYRVDPCGTGAISLQTGTDVTTNGRTTFGSVTLTGTGTYKGRTVTRTLSSDVAARQSNVLPTCT